MQNPKVGIPISPELLQNQDLTFAFSTFSSVTNILYFIFELDFPKQSTKAEGRHPEGGARIILTKEVWKFL